MDNTTLYTKFSFCVECCILILHSNPFLVGHPHPGLLNYMVISTRFRDKNKRAQNNSLFNMTDLKNTFTCLIRRIEVQIKSHHFSI